MTPRPSVPADVRQQLRNEALFGCCRCGKSVYQYHHIIPYETEAHFRPDDMMILCPECHDMATKRILTEAKQRQFKNNPHNRKHGFSKGKLWVNEAAGTVLLSDTSLIGCGCFVSVGGKCLVRLDVGAEGNLELSTELRNKADDLLLKIERNEWTMGDPKLWDLASDYQYLKLRSKPNDILLEINAKSETLRVRAKLWSQGTQINCGHSSIVVRSGSVKDMTLRGNKLSGQRLAVSHDGRAAGIVPMNLHPDDPLFGLGAIGGDERRQE